MGKFEGADQVLMGANRVVPLRLAAARFEDVFDRLGQSRCDHRPDFGHELVGSLIEAEKLAAC
jgi:hypothetical protein